MSKEAPVGSGRGAVVWDVQRDAPGLLEAAFRRAPWLRAELPRLRRRMPVARVCGTFQTSRSVRPEGHHRSFYLRRPGGAVVGVKGAEIRARDLPAKLLKLGVAAAPLKLPSLEYLPIIEQKLPMALTLPEGLAQARQAAAFQQAHLSRYGELARLPVPLLVYRWGDKDVERFAAALLPRLSVQAAEAAGRLFPGGLGVLLYYYPTVPLRALHLAEVLAGAGARGYEERLRRARLFGGLFQEFPSASEIMSRWIDLFARMLALGFLPCHVSHRYGGQILQEQNAVLDGGFVDAEPLRPLREFVDDRRFYESFLLAWLDLSATAKRLLVGHLDRADLSWPFADFSPAYLAVPALIACQVGRRLAARLRQEAAAGAVIDPRIWAVLGDGESLAGLDAALGRLFEEPRPAA